MDTMPPLPPALSGRHMQPVAHKLHGIGTDAVSAGRLLAVSPDDVSAFIALPGHFDLFFFMLFDDLL